MEMSNSPLHPYQNLSNRAYWNRSVSDRHFSRLDQLWDGMPLNKADKIATAGSCFAQHLGQNLAKRGANFMDLEPAPSFLVTRELRRKYGYEIFSCRYGNIYTMRQLLQIFQEAFSIRVPHDIVWERGGRYFDALRPSVDPVGQADADTVNKLRSLHLAQVRKMFESLDVFVVTMGLTEAWVSKEDSTVYPTAPGTIAGKFSTEKYEFANFTFPEVYRDLSDFWEGLRSVNANARLLLTVSPVPLRATASGQHVLPATTYSKSVLRAVAGDFSMREDSVYYFPAYELITSAPGRGMYYEPDWRNVSPYGVDYVMEHFFRGVSAAELHSKDKRKLEVDVVCDEEAMFKAIED